MTEPNWDSNVCKTSSFCLSSQTCKRLVLLKSDPGRLSHALPFGDAWQVDFVRLRTAEPRSQSRLSVWYSQRLGYWREEDCSERDHLFQSTDPLLANNWWKKSMFNASLNLFHVRSYCKLWCRIKRQPWLHQRLKTHSKLTTDCDGCWW